MNKFPVTFVGSYILSCDVIVTVNCEKAEVNAVENSNVP